jgi:hypothetical protein
MQGATRAAAVLVCLLSLVGTVLAQPPVSPRNSYERILVVLPLIGSGTAADPIRPSLIPAPGSATPNILNVPISTPVTGTGVTVTPVGGVPTSTPNLILGYSWVKSDDGNFAITEIVMRDRSAFPSIMALPGVTAFVKGIAKLADIQTALSNYKKNFDITKFGAWVQ